MTTVPACVMVHVLSGRDSGPPDIYIFSVFEGPACVNTAGLSLFRDPCQAEGATKSPRSSYTPLMVFRAKCFSGDSGENGAFSAL